MAKDKDVNRWDIFERFSLASWAHGRHLEHRLLRDCTKYFPLCKFLYVNQDHAVKIVLKPGISDLSVKKEALEQSKKARRFIEERMGRLSFGRIEVTSGWKGADINDFDKKGWAALEDILGACVVYRALGFFEIVADDDKTVERFDHLLRHFRRASDARRFLAVPHTATAAPPPTETERSLRPSPSISSSSSPSPLPSPSPSPSPMPAAFQSPLLAPLFDATSFAHGRYLERYVLPRLVRSYPEAGIKYANQTHCVVLKGEVTAAQTQEILQHLAEAIRPLVKVDIQVERRHKFEAKEERAKWRKVELRLEAVAAHRFDQQARRSIFEIVAQDEMRAKALGLLLFRHDNPPSLAALDRLYPSTSASPPTPPFSMASLSKSLPPDISPPALSDEPSTFNATASQRLTSEGFRVADEVEDQEPDEDDEEQEEEARIEHNFDDPLSNYADQIEGDNKENKAASHAPTSDNPSDSHANNSHSLFSHFYNVPAPANPPSSYIPQSSPPPPSHVPNFSAPSMWAPSNVADFDQMSRAFNQYLTQTATQFDQF